MKRLLPWLMVLSLSPGLWAEDAPDAQELGTAPSGDFTVMGTEQGDGETIAVWVESKGKRANLPPSPMDGGNSWQSSYLPNFTISPDAQWMCAGQKICAGCSAAYLYKRGQGLKFSIATDPRLDILAWRFFGKSVGIDADALLKSQSTLIDILALGDRYLAVSLRGAIADVPPALKVPRVSGDANDPTGIYGWQCLYDLREGKFVVPGVMAEYNQGAWGRWADSDKWAPDADAELNAAYKGLMATLDGSGQKALRTDEKAWLKERDQKVKAKTDELSDVNAQRAAALALRQMETAR